MKSAQNMAGRERSHGVRTGDTNMATKPSAPRVRQHRQQLRQAGNVRLEISIGADVAGDVRVLAKKRDCEVWQVVQAALIKYVTGNRERIK